MNLTNDFKRVLSGMMSVAMTATLVQSFPAIAEDAQITKYPYAVFASSDIEGAITVNAGNFCVNGNVATNGTIVANGNMNVNGTKTENAGEDMIYIFDKIDSAYFSKSNVNEYSDDYILEEMNINITTPTEIMGEATLTGNININTALKAFENVNLYGEVKNTNDSVIFSKYGDIVIDSQNVNLNGLVYAPFGNVVVTAQNLNLNNVVIIADTITFNCPNVNANYSSSAAEFVGTVSDLLDIPYDEWQYMKDENENDFPDFFEDFDNWSKLKDTDGDKLPDCVEQYIGSDSTLADTDGDALDDFYELFVTYTEPAKDDTDDNGILDCDEDFDKDDLSNLEEYLASTSPWDDDTDSDTLKDGEEIDTYGTDPLKPDTDDDGLEDCDEIHLGTDPVNPDTDSDGILDGDEKFYQTYTHIVENEDCVVSEVIVSLEGTGNLQKNTTVKSVMNKDVLCTNVAGLVGEPFNIETSSQFDTATITYKIDQSKLGDTEFDNLMFLWYDEENNEFIELETVLDEPNSTVSVVTTHFSKYMIVDRQAWYDAWALEFNYERKYDNSGVPLKIYNTVLAIDCSGSMSDYDRNGTIRKEAATGFINIMNPNDKTALMFFDSTVDGFHVLTSDKDALLGLLDKRIYTSGGTDFDVALQSAIALLEDEIGKSNVINRIIFMTDGQDSLSTNVLDVAKDNNIMIYTIGFSTNTSDSNLQYYADYTGGEFYKAYNADELIEIYENIALSSDFDTTDTDGDGLFDVVEIAGMRMQNGYVGGENGAPLTTDPTNPDTDGDGLLDGEEIDQTISWKRVINDTGDGSHGAYCIYFNMYSDPNTSDTDGDGLLDGEEMSFSCWSDHSRMLMSDPLKWDTDKDSINDYYDPYPWEYNAGNVYNRQAVVEYAMYWADPIEERYNPDFHISGNDCTNFASQCLNAGGYDMTGEWFNVKAYDSDVSFATRVLLKLYDQYTEDGWIWTGTFVEVPKYYDRISEPLYNTGEITIIDETSFEDALESQVKEGDMVFFFNGDEPCHAAVVSKITDDEIYIAAHSYHQTLGPLSQKYESYDKVAIVKIRDDLVE